MTQIYDTNNTTINNTSTPIIIQQDWRDSVPIKVRVGDDNQQQYWLRYDLKYEAEKQKIRDWNRNQRLERHDGY